MNNKHQRFKSAVLACLYDIGPATWPEMKAWMFESVHGAGRIIPTSAQVGGILGHMAEVEQHPHTAVRRIHHSMATTTAAYAVWSLREDG